MEAPAGSRFAIGTEGHFVRNLREQAALRGIDVEHLAQVPDPQSLRAAGCGCAMMSRNDPPHLAGVLDLLRQEDPLEANRVLAGDVMDETGRDRLAEPERAALVRDGRTAMLRMIEITEGCCAADRARGGAS